MKTKKKRPLTAKERVLKVYPGAVAQDIGGDPFSPNRIQILGWCKCCNQRIKNPLTIWHPTAKAAWADAARKLK